MYQHILVPLDGSATGERGLREAVRLAAEHKSKLRLLHVIEDFAMLMEMSAAASFDAMMREVREYGQKVLSKAQAAAAAANVPAEASLREDERAAASRRSSSTRHAARAAT